MVLDKETKDFITKSNICLHKEITTQINKLLVTPLNEKFNFVYQRFDDMEKRLDKIESKLNIVEKDTKIIPDVFEMLETDGDNIANLTARVDKLDS